MADKLMYIPNDDTQNYPEKLLYIPSDDTQNCPFCRLQLVVETFGHST